MVEKRRRRSDSSVLRYLRNIEAKLDRINERLDRFLSAPKAKRKRAAPIPKRALVFGTKEAAEEYLKKHRPMLTMTTWRSSSLASHARVETECATSARRRQLELARERAKRLGRDRLGVAL
jgi:hypothetical protein